MKSVVSIFCALSLFVSLTYSYQVRCDLLEVHSLSDVRISIPLHRCLAFFVESQDSIDSVKRWIKTVESEKLLPKEISFCVIANFGDSFPITLAKPLIIQALKLKVPKHRWKYVFAVFENRCTFRNSMQLDSEDISKVCVALYDTHGEIQWQYRGDITQSCKKELQDRLSKIK